VTLAARARRLLGLPSPSADALRAVEHIAEALAEGRAAAGPLLHFPTLSPDSQIGYRMTTPTTKTLDLTAHAATFSSTYDHARRMGADRPLSHRFALADVLGEIEKVIEKRVADVVASERRRASREAETVRLRHASELTLARARMAPTSARFVLHLGGPYGFAVREQVTGKLAPFGTRDAAERAVRNLNTGVTLPSMYGWTAR
jgi:hypothetical protein